MSRQNKVNPGKYTQAGRLSQDDAAREVKKQREGAPPTNTEGSHFGLKAKSRVTQKDPPSPRESSAASADRQQTETRKAK